MADAVVSAVINKVVDIGATMIMEEGSRLYWLRADVGWLEREVRHMQGYLENAEAKNVTDQNVVNLIKDIRGLVCDAEDILDIYLPRIESHTSNGFLKRISTCFVHYCWTSSMFSREIAKIRRRVENIDADRTRYGIEDISRTEDVFNVDPRTTRLHVDDPIIVGFEQDSKELKSKLKNHPFVSVVGMPGVGKTTLAKKVFKDIKDDFDCCASVSVSQQPNINDLVRDIANQVGLEKEKQEENLEKNLYSFLQEKRYVVFLDDIWDTTAWNSLKACFPIDSDQSAGQIIITSRNSGVGRYIGGESSLHQLHPLGDSKSWDLFSKLIMPTNKKFDSELEMIGRQIVKKCDGVPLAIVVIVGMLRERGISEFSWNAVLHSIGENASDEFSQILRLSYKDLPTFLKPCFLYFGNFPEDYEFSASEVIQLWMAEKFIPRVRRDWEPEDVGADYISKLEVRNLIQVVKRGHDASVKKFRIHDLLHSFCVNLGRENDFLSSIDHLESSSAMRVRRLSICYDSIAENEKLISQMTRLRALFEFEFDMKNGRHLRNMLGKFKLLQVLQLEFIYKDVYIPSQIGSLSRLNYLEIYSDYWKVQIPSSIQDLKNLHTLDFRRCREGVKLPIGIWKMEQLRHLILWVYEMDSYLMRPLCKYQQVQVLLPNLQTLYRIRCSDLRLTWLVKFTNVRKLGLLEVTPEIMEVLCGLEPISKKLETFHCYGSPDCRLTRRVSLAKYGRLLKLFLWEVQMQQLLELPPSLVKLRLRSTELIEDPMNKLKNLPKLKILHLNWNAYVGSKLDCSGADSFPQLEILELKSLDYLEELIEGEEMGMPKLKQLFIQRCDRLVHIPERLQHLRMKN